MSTTESAPPREEHLQELVESARALTEGDIEPAVTNRLYMELGDLARYLNKMLKKIQSAELEKASSQIPIITGQLSDVTRYTEEETHRILEYTEKTMGNHDVMTTALGSLNEALRAGSPDLKKITGCVDQVYGLAEENKKILMDLLMALSFQDLAGQRMRKIELVMHEVQSRILKLILALGLKTRERAAEAPAETPTVLPERLNQDVVDDLLKEFGF